jgi:hypothetical protein
MIDFSDDEFKDDEQVSYCAHCLQYGFKVPLQNRIYPEGKPVPADKDQWKMCLDCGNIYAVYELEKESQIKDVAETIQSPFDSVVDFLGIDRRVLGKKSRKRKQQQDDYDYVNDDDLKRELKKGSKLLSYSEEMPQ